MLGEGYSRGEELEWQKYNHPLFCHLTGGWIGDGDLRSTMVEKMNKWLQDQRFKLWQDNLKLYM